MTREDRIDAAFAADEIGDINEMNNEDEDDDEEFGSFIAEALSRKLPKPEKRSGARKARRRRWQHMIGRTLNQPAKPDLTSMHPLERFVFLGIEPDGKQ